MELEKQVVSLELAKRLKELGVKQESAFYWAHWYDGLTQLQTRDQKERPALLTPHGGREFISAFTVAELGMMIPGDYILPYREGSHSAWVAPNRERALTEADARAKFLIYLISEKGILTHAARD